MRSRQAKSGKKIYRSTFTYFIPAPPQRKNGYREVEFDKIMKGIFESGFEIESFNVQSLASGIYVVAILKTNNKKVAELDAALDLHEKFQLSHKHAAPDLFFDEEEDV